MSKGRVYISDYPDNPPEWYWQGGLHDACVIGAEAFEFPFDYNKFKGKKNKDNYNALVLKIDASGALGDTSVEEICLFNYEILSKHISIVGRTEVWWLADRLVDRGQCYVMEIDMQDFDANPEEFIFKIKFESAEVKRKF